MARPIALALASLVSLASLLLVPTAARAGLEPYRESNDPMAAYHDPALKWAAEQIYRERQADPPDVYLATVASLGWKWCDDDIPASPPLGVDEALDDLVIKKIVWRTGWERQDSYACLNYRDEGAYGYVARDYLRNTLAVSAEKMHHGHADEGSFSMLVHAGTLLLHESGYRERPPDGVYRSALYHNRLVWKTGKQTASGSLLEFLRGDGHYHPVLSERLYQTNLGDFQCGAAAPPSPSTASSRSW